MIRRSGQLKLATDPHRHTQTFIHFSFADVGKRKETKRPMKAEPKIADTLNPTTDVSDPDGRRDWRSDRSARERYYYHTFKCHFRRFTEWVLFKIGKRLFFDYLRGFAFYERGFQNAARIALNQISIEVSNLPAAFESYKILHITDLHIDSLAEVEDTICELIDGIPFDLCLFSGDFTREMAGPFEHILGRVKKIVDAVDARDGVYTSLGNHDTHRMIEAFEKMKITFLINETVSIYRGKEKIAVTGLDDPHLYLTDQTVEALHAPNDGFKIALVHSPELYDVAADCGYDLYLCGHTHGGQICLPSGTPLVTHLKHGRQFFRGLWKHAGMTGYTNPGAGVVSVPLRYNTQSEIALITLRGKNVRD